MAWCDGAAEVAALGVVWPITDKVPKLPRTAHERTSRSVLKCDCRAHFLNVECSCDEQEEEVVWNM